MKKAQPCAEKRQGKSGVEHGDESFGQKAVDAYHDSHRNHARHHNPHSHISEEGERTVLPLFLRNAQSIFLVQPMEDEGEKQKPARPHRL